MRDTEIAKVENHERHAGPFLANFLQYLSRPFNKLEFSVEVKVFLFSDFFCFDPEVKNVVEPTPYKIKSKRHEPIIKKAIKRKERFIFWMLAESLLILR